MPSELPKSTSDDSDLDTVRWQLPGMEGTSDDTHLADDSKRGENAAGSSGYAPKAAPDWKPGYFRAIAQKRAGDGSAGSTVEQAGIGNSEPAASANSLNSADTHRADTHRERRIARTVEQTGNEDEDPGETCSRLCSGVPPPAASRSVSSSASDSEEEWRRQHPEPFEGAKEAAEKLRRIKHERNYQRHRSASTLCKHLNRRGGCRHGCTPTKTYCHKYQRGQCHRGLNCRYAHS